jgi:hypothetical protein
MTRASDLTLLDIADKLLDTGVSLTGEATISVADVDLIYLGLDVVLASVERIRGQGTVPLVPFPRWPDALMEASYPPRADRGPQDEVEHGGPSEGSPRARVGGGDEVEHLGPREWLCPERGLG